MILVSLTMPLGSDTCLLFPTSLKYSVNPAFKYITPTCTQPYRTMNIPDSPFAQSPHATWCLSDSSKSGGKSRVGHWSIQRDRGIHSLVFSWSWLPASAICSQRRGSRTSQATLSSNEWVLLFFIFFSLNCVYAGIFIISSCSMSTDKGSNEPPYLGIFNACAHPFPCLKVASRRQVSTCLLPLFFRVVTAGSCIPILVVSLHIEGLLLFMFM